MFNLKKISIIVVVIILAFIAYSYFISGNSSQSSSGISKQSVSSSGTTSATPGTSALDGPGKDFVTQLLAIQNIKFNLDLFNDPVFKGLQNYHQDLVPQEAGRPNPFAPLDGTSSISDGSASAGGAYSTYGMSTSDPSASSSVDTSLGANGNLTVTGTTPSKTKTSGKAPIKK